MFETELSMNVAWIYLWGAKRKPSKSCMVITWKPKQEGGNIFQILCTVKWY